MILIGIGNRCPSSHTVSRNWATDEVSLTKKAYPIDGGIVVICDDITESNFLSIWLIIICIINIIVATHQVSDLSGMFNTSRSPIHTQLKSQSIAHIDVEF